MTDKKSDYYQPWLRDPAPTPSEPPTAATDRGLAKPKDKPPVGIDLSRRPVDEPPPRGEPLISGERIGAGAQGLWRGMRRGAAAFADWTIRVGARADIPARARAMEIPRRSRELAQKGGAASARAARTVGRGSARAASAAAAASGRGWRKMALGDKVARLSDEAGRGLGEVAGKTRAGIGSAAKAGKDGIGEAAAKLRPPRREEPTPPPSGLDQLLAREAAEAPKAKPAAADLPLFADAPTAAQAPAAQDDDRTPHIAAAPSPGPAPRAGAMAAASPPPRAKNATTSDRKAAPWLLGVGVIALLAAAFWLGGRFGGGMSKNEVETVVADYIMANPQIIPAALEAQRDSEIAKAIDTIRPALERPYAGAWAGNANGDVTMVVFTDYACGFCRASVPDIDRLLREDKMLKVVFRELPIIAPQSREAALMALAAARQGKYDAFHHAMFAAPSLQPAAIAAAAAKAGVVTDGSADATADEALFQRELDSNLAIATQLQLNATPTWIIGDRMLQGQVGYATLRQAVADARAKS